MSPIKNKRSKTNEEKVEKRLKYDVAFEKIRTGNIKELITLDELLKEKR